MKPKIENYILFLAGAGAGIGAAYFFDGRSGARRRAMVRDKVRRAGNQAIAHGSRTARDIGNRAKGFILETKGAIVGEAPSDDVLEARVRARLGHLVANPSVILVSAERGRIAIRGPVLKKQLNDLIAEVHAVPGVAAVDNFLDIFDTPEEMLAAQETARTTSREKVA